MIFGGIIPHLIFPDAILPLMYLTFGSIGPSLLASILIHECGHLIAARWSNLRILQLMLGEGPLRWRGTLLGIRVQLMRSINRASVWLGSPLEVNRNYWIATVAAGPFFNLCAAGIVYALIAFQIISPAKTFIAFVISCIFIAINLVQGIQNLIPMWSRTLMRTVPNDGLYILKNILKSEETVFRPTSEAFFVAAFNTAEAFEDFTEALDWVQMGLERFPTSISLLDARALLYCRDGDFAKSRDIWGDLLSREGIADQARAICKNNLAYCFFCQQRDSDLETADQYSRDALEFMPWFGAFNSTRGAVLLWQGKESEAVPLLELAQRENKDKNLSLAVNKCLLSMAHLRLGEAQKAVAMLSDAIAHDPNCQLLPRVQKLLDQCNRVTSNPETPRDLKRQDWGAPRLTDTH